MGPVVKRDVMKASVMLEHEVKYAVILAFDVKIERDAQDMSDSLGVKIFQVSFYTFYRVVFIRGMYVPLGELSWAKNNKLANRDQDRPSWAISQKWPPYHNYHFWKDAKGRDGHAYESKEHTALYITF